MTQNLISGSAKSQLIYMLCQVLVPSLSITASYFVAKKHEAVADLHGPIFLGSYAATVYAITIFNLIEINSVSMTFDMGISLIYYFMYIGFMSTDFMFHFIIRSILYALVRFHVGYTRVQNDESEALASFALNFCGLALAESIFYV